jgi:hypothetical protein
MGLGRKKIDRLVDLLRMNLLYQTPRVEVPPGAVRPIAVHVRLLPGAYAEAMALIREHGGWDLTEDQRREVYRRHEQVTRRAMGDGVNYDLSDLSYGDLAQMWTELQSLGDLEDDLALRAFRSAIGDELERQRAGQGVPT